MTLVIAMVFYVLDRLTLIRVCVNPTLSNIRLENENVLFFFHCCSVFLYLFFSFFEDADQFIKRHWPNNTTKCRCFVAHNKESVIF